MVGCSLHYEHVDSMAVVGCSYIRNMQTVWQWFDVVYIRNMQTVWQWLDVVYIKSMQTVWQWLDVV